VAERRTSALGTAQDAAAFLANQRAIREGRAAADAAHAEAQNALTEAAVELRQLQRHYDEVEAELQSLYRRRSNIPRQILDIRDRLCEALGLREEELPFAGELLQVRPEEQAWEGAIERLLHNFALSLLVRDEQYAQVAEWVEGTHLGGRLVYF